MKYIKNNSKEYVRNQQEEYVRTQRIKRRAIISVRFFILLFFLIQWELTAQYGIIDSFFFSSPGRIIKTIIKLSLDYSLFRNIAVTLVETLVSFFLVIVLGFLSAMALWLKPCISEVLEPYLVVLNSLPKSALAPLFIVWLGANVKTIIVAGISVAIFGSIISLYTGFSGTDEDKIKLIYTLGGNKRDVFFKVVFPSNIPTIISTMKVNIGLALVGVVIGEFLAARAGLGYLIIYGSQVFQLDLVLMSIVILCSIAMLLYGVISILEKKYRKINN